MSDTKDVAVLREELNQATNVLSRTTEKLTEANTELILAQQKLSSLTSELSKANVEMNRAKKQWEKEQMRLYHDLKSDISHIKEAALALEVAVSKLEEGTDLTQQSLASLVS